MKTEDKLPSLDQLGAEIQTLHQRVSPARKPRPQGFGSAMQMGLELVAGVLVGLGIGIALDKWLGTSPVFLLICFFLGAAGGGLTLYRTATAMAKQEETDETAANSSQALTDEDED